MLACIYTDIAECLRDCSSRRREYHELSMCGIQWVCVWCHRLGAILISSPLSSGDLVSWSVCEQTDYQQSSRTPKGLSLEIQSVEIQR